MARCLQCHEEIVLDDHFCPHCGAVQPRRPSPREQPELPFSPWVPPRMTLQPTGASAPHAEPYVGPPMTVKQVAIAVCGILLFLLLVVMVGREGGLQGLLGGKAPDPVAAPAPLPLLGKMNEAITIGKTAWGVAFTDQAQTVDHRPPTRGKYLSVGIIIVNQSDMGYYLSTASVGLLDDATGERFTPKATAWGTATQILSGHYSNKFALQPGMPIDGLIVFDVPTTIAHPRLLVRDLAAPSPAFSGMIDLSK